MTAIVLFEDDFRTEDSPALYFACQKYENIIPVFIYNENYLGRRIGAASKVFLHYVLKSFSQTLLKEYGVNLLILQGEKLQILQEITQKTNAKAVYFSKSYTVKQMEVESQILQAFPNLDVQLFQSKILFDPEKIKTGGNQNFKVFTPFSKECLKNLDLTTPSLPKPEKFLSNYSISGLTVEQLSLLPKNEGNWHQTLASFWNFNYNEVNANFQNFIENKVKDYKEKRNNPADGCHSNISPYLRFGFLSPKICFEMSGFYFGKNENQYSLELLWREFAYHSLFYNPKIQHEEIRAEYGNFAWESDSEGFKKWKTGETGFEFVDAGMKELLHTGTMHGRTRMVTASFLIKDLLISWKDGEEWFWNCLADADPAVNPFSWQWVFGSGYDGAPYFRIFNPSLQKDRFDPQSKYCTKWLGNFYNTPKIVDHSLRRDLAMERYKAVLK